MIVIWGEEGCVDILGCIWMMVSSVWVCQCFTKPSKIVKWCLRAKASQLREGEDTVIKGKFDVSTFGRTSKSVVIIQTDAFISVIIQAGLQVGTMRWSVGHFGE